MRVKDRGQLSRGTSALLLPCGSQESIKVKEAWQQAPPTEPSHQPVCFHFLN